MDNNKASVKIYGQEYVIAGEKSREHIVKVAAYVDNKMHDISETASSCPVSSLAVLSAVNICDEYFTALAELESMKRKNAQLENDAQRYVQLWEEAKKPFSRTLVLPFEGTAVSVLFFVVDAAVFLFATDRFSAAACGLEDVFAC